MDQDRLQDFRNTSVFFLLLLLSLNLVKAQSSDVSIENVLFNSEGVSLEGTLYTPQYPHAAIVLVHGAGQVPRMSEFASHLAENGITVFAIHWIKNRNHHLKNKRK